MNDPYKALNVDKNATDEDIKKAYKHAAKKNHPDKGGDIGKMQNINKAYAILKNPVLREKFDRTGETDENVNADDMIIMQIITRIIDQMIAKPPMRIHEHLSNIKSENEFKFLQSQQSLNNEKKQVQQFQKRILKSPDKDMLGNLLENRLRNIEFNLEKNKINNDLFNKAVKILGTYSYQDIKNNDSDFARVFGIPSATTFVNSW